MFEKYDINELYLGSVSVDPIGPEDWETNIGGIFFESTAGYGYLTILRKLSEDSYVDLKDMKPIGTVRNPHTTSYTIDYVEPLSDYYTQDGKKKDIFSRRQAVREAKNHYDAIHKKHYDMLVEQNSQQKILK